MPSLTELLSNANLPTDTLSTDPEITHITSDSRVVQEGSLYVAIPGTKLNGEEFVPEALQKGAVAVVSENEVECDHDIACLQVKSARYALAKLAAAFYNRQPEHIVAVTGTDGKTSTVEFYRQLAERCGFKAAAMGTLGTLGLAGLEVAPGLRTTPDPVRLMQVMRELADKEYTHVAMEASSHGLHQYRLDGVKLSAAAFTNLTRDHLDYHVTDENYFAAKMRLFIDLLPQGSTAVVNADDPRFDQIKRIVAERNLKLIDFGKSAEQFRILSHRPTTSGQHIKLNLMGQEVEYDLNQVGLFQVYNILTAAGLLMGSGAQLEDIIQNIPKLKGVPGRLEHVASLPNGAAAFVDYAHTDAALQNVLKTLRDHCGAKLSVVFGCGGDRDRGKRPLMAEAACKLADRVYVTDDNPRTEDPDFIRKEVMAGCPRAKEIGDRREAIQTAVSALQSGDILLVSGKGHEKEQIIGNTAHPFDDAAVIRDAVTAL